MTQNVVRSLMTQGSGIATHSKLELGRYTDLS